MEVTKAELQQALQFHSANRLDDAEAIYRRILAVEAKNSDALHLLGVVYLQKKDFKSAIELIEKAIQVGPHSASMQNNFGNALRAVGRSEDAEKAYQKAIKLRPNAADSFLNLAGLFLEQNKATEAEVQIRKALQLSPHLLPAKILLGMALKLQGKRHEARRVFQALSQAEPQSPEVWTELATIQMEIGEIKASLQSHEKALALAPDSFAILNNSAATFRLLGKLDLAEKVLSRALTLQPGLPEASVNLGMLKFLQGKWEEGFSQFSLRTQTPAFRSYREIQIPEWKGEDLSGKTLLVLAEQGAGDSIQFLRLLADSIFENAKIYFSCPRRLHRLIRSAGIKNLELVDSERTPPAANFKAVLLNLLGQQFSKMKPSTPAAPYLFAEPETIEKWRSRVSALPGLKVGICWQGSKKYPEDAYRSISLQNFEPLIDIPGVTFVSLQQGEGIEQLKSVSFQNKVIDWSKEIDARGDAFIDTAAIMSLLDVVVTSDTSIAHLAGALGVETFALLQKVPEWRFGLSQTDNPWYSKMHLVRQNELEDWQPVFANVAEQIHKRKMP